MSTTPTPVPTPDRTSGSPAEPASASSRRRRPPVRYVVVGVLAVVAVLAAALGSWAVGSGGSSAKDRIEADPPPALFPVAQTAATQRQVEAQSARADRLMAQWWAEHGHGRDDRAFTAWLEKTLPPPPAARARAAEVDDVVALAARRSSSGVAASTWLEAHGKKDLWKLYAHDQAELLPGPEGDARKDDVSHLLKMSKQVADALGQRYQQSAPYVLHPEVRPDHHVVAGQVCPCSYPSRHAAAGAAATTYLGGLDPERVGEYRWTEGEIDYSRIYMAGHVPSDVTAGALLGDLVGRYWLDLHGPTSGT